MITDTSKKIDYTQYVIPATKKEGCMVVMPYNVFTHYGDSRFKEGVKDADKT